jgi:hypothetical protein
VEGGGHSRAVGCRLVHDPVRVVDDGASHCRNDRVLPSRQNLHAARVGWLAIDTPSELRLACWLDDVLPHGETSVGRRGRVQVKPLQSDFRGRHPRQNVVRVWPTAWQGCVRAANVWRARWDVSTTHGLVGEHRVNRAERPRRSPVL